MPPSHYFGHRYLIARIGRWASADPLSVHAMGGGEAVNAYHYVSGNLLSAYDPDGLDAKVAVEPGTDGTQHVQMTMTVVVVPDGEVNADELLRAAQQQAEWLQTRLSSDSVSLRIGGRDVEATLSVHIHVRLATEEEMTGISRLTNDEARERYAREEIGRGTNIIRIAGNATRTHVSHGGATATLTSSDTRSDIDGSTLAMAHEMGHLLGLDDRYNERTGTHPGFEHNFMANGSMDRSSARLSETQRAETVESAINASRQNVWRVQATIGSSVPGQFLTTNFYFNTKR